MDWSREKLKERYNEHPVIWPLLKQGQAINSRLNYHYYYKWPGSNQRASTREINLEFASQCNLRCQFCALDHDKPKKNMSILVLRKLLDDWLEDDRFHDVAKINLYNGGETLLHPKRVEMLRVIKEYKNIALEKGLPFPKVSMLTNGMLLRPKLIDTLLEEELVDEIGFSLDGGTPESFEELRVNAKWKPFYHNVRYLLEAIQEKQANIRVYGITIVTDDKPLNTSWMHPEFVELSEGFDHHELRRLHDWGGQVDTGKKQNSSKSRGCDLLLRQMIVLPNGDVSVCCNDLNSKGVIGNIMEKPLWKVYNSENRRRYLELLDKGRKEEIELCRDCVTF
ncbi:MAG: radical SAM protein [Flavobacteriia bacterium]|nr:radical SAM protein [Flavobacteriia bacterium]